MHQNPMGRREALALVGAAVSPIPKATGASSRRKVIVVGAHPDDPETGCGGVMLRCAERGDEVVAAYLTAGEAGIAGLRHDEAARIRKAEAAGACAILGARPAFIGQVDGAAEITPRRYEEMRAFLSQEKADLVFAHWPVDTHRDHRIASVLVYDAWLGLGRAFALYYFEVMTGTQTQNFFPTHFVDISSVMERKHRASFAHVSQSIEADYGKYHGRMETYRGMQRGVQAAEAFAIHEQSREVPLP
jgi:LmbE family N-acetylglucosaminyl deacetylase